VEYFFSSLLEDNVLMILADRSRNLIFITSCCLSAFGQSSDKSVQADFSSKSRSVVIVEALDYNYDRKEFTVASRNSGVVVSVNQVITNRHIVDAGDGWRIRQGEKSWRAIVTDIDPDHDLALLQATDENLELLKGNNVLNAPPVLLRAQSTVSKGERVYAIGSSDGQKLTISEGVVTGFREYENGRLIQTSTSVYVASSGGGLFDSRGRLIGVLSGSLTEGHNVNFALPADWVQPFIHLPVAAGNKQEKGESESFKSAQVALMNLQTMVFQRRILHDRPIKPESARAASWLVGRSQFECIRDVNSPNCFDNWPLWKRASILMLDLRENIKRAQPATDELDGRFIDAARSAWSGVSDIYCAVRPGSIYTDLEDKIRVCPNLQ
jgi:hypothetical protein